MRPTRQPLYRLALCICRRLERLHDRDAQFLEGQLAQAYESARALCRHFEQYKQVRGLGWSHAAEKKRQDVLFHLRTFQKLLAGEWVNRPVHSGCPQPSVAFVLAELRNLYQEFGQVDVDPKAGTISVRTDAIELQEVHLGPFEIRLHISRLWPHPDSHSFDCVALDPNPASGNDSVTHPHVKNNDLCAGDAASTLSAALQEGRLVDAFQLVNSVLHTYGEGSPYVSLDQWEGVNCPDCGRSASLEDMSYCEGCMRDVCSQCMGRCDVCCDPCCHNCLEEDTATGQQCCPECCGHCDACGRVVRSDTQAENDGLCAECADTPADDETTPQPQENLSHEPVLQPNDSSTTDNPQPAGQQFRAAEGAGDLIQPTSPAFPAPSPLLPV